MHCNTEFGYKLSICSGTKENHGKPCSSWPIAGPSACELTSSQQSGIEFASPNIVSLSVRLLYCRIRTQFDLQKFLRAYYVDKQHTVHSTWENDACLCALICIQENVSLHLYIRLIYAKNI
jgi:hypothetical protein